jgi:hypothetical protein
MKVRAARVPLLVVGVQPGGRAAETGFAAALQNYRANFPYPILRRSLPDHSRTPASSFMCLATESYISRSANQPSILALSTPTTR